MGLNKEDGVFSLLLVAYVSFCSLQTTSGNVIDCVDIHKQPALDNPLLKDHKIQMGNSSSSSMTEGGTAGIFSLGQGCPDGTIPILRTTKRDLIREKFLSRFTSGLSQPYAGFTSRAGIEVDGNRFHGARAAIEVCSPECKGDQFSASLIRVASGREIADTNAIYIGWAVSPAVYGDDHPHLLTFWKGGDGSTGCFDLLCRGFVQTDKGIVLGAPINKTSVYGGIDQQFYVQITQDLVITKNWILSFGDPPRQAGYWPKELFPFMAGDTGATSLFFGGITMSGTVHDTLPPMGSGHKPDITTFMNQIYFAEQNSEFRPLSKIRTKGVLDNPEFYYLNNYGMSPGYGYFLIFGGPGGSAVTAVVIKIMLIFSLLILLVSVLMFCVLKLQVRRLMPEN